MRRACLLLFLWVLAVPAFAQPANDEDGPMAWISVVVRPGHPTRLSVNGHGSGPEIASALARMSGRPAQAIDYENGWGQWSCSLPVPSHDGLLVRQTLPLEPLLEVLRDAGQPSVVLLVQQLHAGSIRVPAATVLARSNGMLNVTLSTGHAGPIVFESGWRRADVARVIGALALAFLAPILAGLLVWRRSLRRDHKPDAWFVPAFQVHGIVMAGCVAWTAVVEGTGAKDLLDSALFSGGRPLFGTRVFLLFAFLPAAWALSTLMRKNTQRLRGFDPHPRGMAGVLGSARAMLSLLLLMVAFSAFAAGQVRIGVFALLATLFAGVLLPGARGPLGTKPQALSTGALRDRLFDLANRAGVKLRELYVAPMRRERMVNAFAISGGTVMLTDELLDRMSRREVDAVLAHEVTHLEHGHPQKALLSAIFVWGTIAGVGLPLRVPYVIPAGLGLAWLTYLFVARRFEFAADAGAAALTSDPEAVISGLGRLAKLNDSPLVWGRRTGWLITHPTTEARARAVGRRAGLAAGRVMELLTNGLDEGERYGGAERPGEEQRVFSTAWKTRVVSRLSLALLSSAVAAPALSLAVAKALGLEIPHAVAILAGAVPALAGMLLAQDLLAARGMSRLESEIRRVLGMGRLGTYVALSPGDRARIYEGFHDWDLGVVEINADRLMVRGEQVTLELPRAAIRAIELGARAPSWIGAPRVIVRWAGPNGEESLALRPAACTRVSAITPATRALATKLQEWLGPAATPGALHGPAGIGPVTARTPREAAAPRDLPPLIVVLGLLSAGVAFALGFVFWRGLDVFAAAFLGVMAMRWPAMTAREPRAASTPSAPADRRAA